MTTTLGLHRSTGRRWARPTRTTTSARSSGPTDATNDQGTPDPSAAEEKPPLWRRTLSLLFTALIIAGAIYLWPARLGGETRLVIVSGQSMEPTYDLGDLVVTRGGSDPEVGDTVVFEVPEGTAEGMLVIHRILEQDDEGRFITQGDNRETPDQWPLTEADIVGEPLLHVPKGGLIVRFFQQLWVLAIVLGLLAMFLLWPDQAETESEPEELAAGSGDGLPDDDASDVPDPALDDVTLPLRRPDLAAMANNELTAEVLTVGRWSSTPIDDAAMAEAELWLDQQLSAALEERTPATVGH